MPELWDILDESGNKTGRLCERGSPMQKGEYHLSIQVWIKNSKNVFLISRRTNNGGWWSGLWQTTGGATVSGDNSLETALKETREEIGIILEPKNGQLFKRYSEPHKKDDGNVFIDVWLFQQDFDIETVVLQPEETCDAMWASKEKIKDMINNGKFIQPKEAYPYIDEFFKFISVDILEKNIEDKVRNCFEFELIETNRCMLRRLTKNDITEAIELFVNYDVRRYLGGSISINEAVKKINSWIDDSDSLHLCVRLKSNKQFIGIINISHHHNPKNKELSYQFLPMVWGMGYAFEVIYAVIEYCSNTLNIKYIVSETQTENMRSCKLLRKLGYKLSEKIIRFGAEQSIYFLNLDVKN